MTLIFVIQQLIGFAIFKEMFYQSKGKLLVVVLYFISRIIGPDVYNHNSDLKHASMRFAPDFFFYINHT